MEETKQENTKVKAGGWKSTLELSFGFLTAFGVVALVVIMTMILLGVLLSTPCPQEVAEQEALKRLIDGEEVPMSEISWLFESESRTYYLERYLPVLGYPEGSEEYERLMKELPGHEEIKVRYNSPAQAPGGDEI